MAFKRRMLAPIHSEKHLIQYTGGVVTVAQGAARNDILATAVSVADKNLANEVIEGSIIKACYVEAWILSNSASVPGNFIATLEKVENGNVGITFAQAILLNDYPNKKNILYTAEGLTGNNDDNNPLPILRGWYSIPKGKQRFGLGDSLVLTFASQVSGLKLCGLAIYKEYT